MSFFDEADEPEPRQQTRRPRTGGGAPRGRSGRPPGSSGPPPRTPHQQEIHNRRLIAVGVGVVIVILIAVLLAGSGGDSGAIKNYNARVYRLVMGSDQNATNVLKDLKGGDLTGITQSLAQAEKNARNNLASVQGLHAPSEMAATQSSLVDMMRLRQQGLLAIASNAQGAASKSTSKDAIYQISVGTSLLYSSDVLYKALVSPGLAEGLNSAGIPIGSGGGDEQPIYDGQVIPDLGWLNQTWIADAIGAKLSTSQANAGNDQPNLKHGDQLNSATVDGQTLTGGGSYTIPAADAQTWVLNVTNGGETNENDVGCSVKVNNVSDEGTATIPTILKGATDSCTVKLLSAPPKSAYTVTATVAAVPGEKNLKNNTQIYTVTFN